MLHKKFELILIKIRLLNKFLKVSLKAVLHVHVHVLYAIVSSYEKTRLNMLCEKH